MAKRIISDVERLHRRWANWNSVDGNMVDRRDVHWGSVVLDGRVAPRVYIGWTYDQWAVIVNVMAWLLKRSIGCKRGIVRDSMPTVSPAPTSVREMCRAVVCSSGDRSSHDDTHQRFANALHRKSFVIHAHDLS
jgi:hypothetical protein